MVQRIAAAWKSPGRRLAVAMAVIALSGCVSSSGKDKALAEFEDPTEQVGDQAASDTVEPSADTPQNAASGPQKPSYVDPMVSSAENPAAASQQPEGPVVAGSATSEPASLSGLAMQPTGINANRSSIFSLSAPRAPDPVMDGNAGLPAPDAPAYAPQEQSPPAFNSLFKAGQNAAEPSEPAPNAEPRTNGDSAAKTSSRAGLQSSQLAYMGIDDLPEGKVGGLYTLSDTVDRDDEEPVGLMKLASLSGLTRIAPNGLTIQTRGVNVGCFKPDLIGIIKGAEKHFGKKAIVTSGYRDVLHNKRVGGAEGSLHKSCDAADIQLAGVTKWDLADYLRGQGNSGGVGTYCHTASVHIDTGPRRDWNWSCRRNPAVMAAKT